MPRYKVREKRSRTVEYLIDAEDDHAAGKLDGEIIEEGGDADDYGDELLSVEQVGDETDCLGNA